jgi:tRNA pseudouridine38-40 synthase
VTVVRLDLAYDGTAFHGWARQQGQRTVQGVLESALERLTRSSVRLSVAGRTDRGVHAEWQVASFVLPAPPDPAEIQRRLNRFLAPEVVIRAARLAPDGFDARRSASSRQYAYRIETGPHPSPFDARFVWHRPGRLHLPAMRAAARHLVGEHDFGSFCRAPGNGASTVRTLRRLSIAAEGSRVVVRARADAFLHQMVRSLVGTLVAVGSGRLDADSMPELIVARARAAAGPVAPPHGLTLEHVTYGPRVGRPPARW